ncbi:trypsin-like peptidase domain-containing protein [uncultured Porphyromonas sp.]|uniref:trypsin-like peptidase domain-containing protein n=1 Tax=uncultured Porphyromonas sp. TaxID=159274 RepID=UPI002805FB38|nr:trypsin-like peptidase domain-containing protein [uncultured Porphyromonas sp.]
MNRLDTDRSCTGLLSYSRYVCLSLVALLLALPAVAQLATPLPATIVADLGERHATLRSAPGVYQLHATSRTEPASSLRQSGETAPSGLRLLELPAIEYCQLPKSQLWGDWITTPSGERAWQGVLQLEEAGWNTLYFDQYQLNRGDMLFITNEEGEVRGAFTEANNVSSHSLTTAPLYGERLIVYYYPASGERRALPWRLSTITTALLTAVGEELPPAVGGHKGPGSPWFIVKGLECAEATVRHPEVERIARSEILLVVRGRFFSSGTLINNSRQDGEALVLTAAHCLNNSYACRDLDYVRQSAEQSVFYFNYFSPTGDPLINGIEEQTLAGAELVAYNEEHDMCLLRITGVKPDVPQGQCAIPPSYRPYLAGWNAERDFPVPVIGIHHPKASVRRYNRADEKPPLENYDMASVPVRWVNSHLHIKKWDVGTTAGGSSGSGLFDKNHHLIGALTGGSSYCGTPYNDYYYALSEAFTGYPDDKCLKPHLAPTSDQTILEGLDPFAAKPPVRLSHQLYSLMRDSVLIRRDDASIGGVAVRYDIDTSVQYLGSVLVLGAMQEWTPVTLTIYGDEEGKPGKKLYEQTLPRPSYLLVNDAGQSPQQRTLSDAFQAFFPAKEDTPLTLAAGSYYIALEGSEGKALSAPLLMSKAQLHATPYAWHLVGSSWEPAQIDGSPYLGHYWIDPIVLGNLKAGGTAALESVNEPRVILAGERLYLLLPEAWLAGGTPAEVELYSAAGQRILSLPLTDVRSSLSLADYALQSGVYIVHLTGAGERYNCKLIRP